MGFQTLPVAGATEPVAGEPLMPRVEAAALVFAGYTFHTGAEPPATAGVFILTVTLGGRLWAAYVGEADDMAAAISAVKTADAAAGATQGVAYLPYPLARQRGYVCRDLIGKLNPPLNLDHRKAATAPSLAAVIADRAAALFPPPGAPEPLVVHEDDLTRLVHRFYELGDADAVLGPIFRRIPHRAEHLQIIVDFWSRSLMGTTRYRGNPFGPHMRLKLTRESFTRWVALFEQAAHETLHPTAAQRAIARAQHMSESFQAGLFLPDTAPA
jgi:truncated hemoglobin YjbI